MSEYQGGRVILSKEESTVFSQMVLNPSVEATQKRDITLKHADEMRFQTTPNGFEIEVEIEIQETEKRSMEVETSYFFASTQLNQMMNIKAAPEMETSIIESLLQSGGFFSDEAEEYSIEEEKDNSFNSYQYEGVIQDIAA